MRSGARRRVHMRGLPGCGRSSIASSTALEPATLSSTACSGTSFARPRPSPYSAAHQRLGKRHPRLRHQAQNLRRDRQRQRPQRPRRDARPRQNLQETQNPLLRLSRRPLRHPRTPNPTSRNPDPSRAQLSPSPGNLPRLHNAFAYRGGLLGARHRNFPFQRLPDIAARGGTNEPNLLACSFEQIVY